MAKITREWPDLIYDYLRKRRALRHVFHLVDARNHGLLPADKQLLSLLAKAQRRNVRYTIVITKIDVVNRSIVAETAENIKEELAPYCDVDIMYASARSLRGIDHLWSKIWQTVTETALGARHRAIGMRELQRLRALGPKKARDWKNDSLAEMLDLEEPERIQDFDNTEAWAEDVDMEPVAPGQSEEYFDDVWGEDLDEEEEDDRQHEASTRLGDMSGTGLDGSSFDEAASSEEEDLDDRELERRWEDFDDDDNRGHHQQQEQQQNMQQPNPGSSMN